MELKELKTYQTAQLELLEHIDKICGEIGINYYMIGGTLLGAVRHRGFIPWDADIDIAMLRRDYERFKEYWSKVQSERYFYQHYTTERNYRSPHATLRIRGTHVVLQGEVSEAYSYQEDGIYLDIFPLDEPPCSIKDQKKQMKIIRCLRRIIELKAGYTYGTKTGAIKRIAKRIVQLCLSPISFFMLNEKLDKQMSKYEGEGSGFLVSMASQYSYWKQMMPQSFYGEPQRLYFEGKEYLAPAEPDQYLKQIYGDYWTLPPEEKRYTILNVIVRVDYGAGE